MKYIVLTGVIINTSQCSLLYSVALRGTRKLGLYNYAELEENCTPHARTRFTLEEAKGVKSRFPDHDPIGHSPRLIQIIACNGDRKMNTALIQYEIDSIKLWKKSLSNGLTMFGRGKEFKF